MGLERTRTNNKVRTSFKYGWDEFCASNHLNICDTCFFSAIHEATCNDDKELEKQEDDEAKHKVELHKTNDRWMR